MRVIYNKLDLILFTFTDITSVQLNGISKINSFSQEYSTPETITLASLDIDIFDLI